MKIKLTFLALLIAGTLQAQITVDQKYHFGAGVVISTWGTFAGNSMNLKPEKAALFGLASAATAGIGKELWDKIDYGKFDTKDLNATIVGGFVGAGLSYAALKIFKKPPVIYSFADSKSIQVGVKIRL